MAGFSRYAFAKTFGIFVALRQADLTARVPECVGRGILEEDTVPGLWGNVRADGGSLLGLHDCGCSRTAWYVGLWKEAGMN